MANIIHGAASGAADPTDRDETNRFAPVAFENDRPIATRIEHRDRLQDLNVDAAALAAALQREVRGEVRFDNGSRALYSTDASNYRQVPIGVVMPRTVDDVISTVALARKFGAPILARGGGTSLAGQCCNVAVVMDFSKYMNHVIELDPQHKFARVQPGLILDDLRAQAEKHNLTFGPDPATHTHCTLGGMIGNNSCGVHSLMAGKTVDNIEELDILTYDGHRMTVGRTSEAQLAEIIDAGGRRGDIYRRMRDIRDRYADLIRTRYPKIPRRVSGYNLDELLPENGFNVARALVGTECTCVVVLEAKCRLVASPPSRTLVCLGYDDVFIAADDVPRILEFKPLGLEGFDERLLADMRAKNLNVDKLHLLPEGAGWLLVEFGGATKQESDARAREMMDAVRKSSLVPTMKLYEDKKEERSVWAIRESGLGATAFVPGKPRAWEGWEDSAVDPTHLGKYLRDLRKLLDKYGYVGDLYGHFGEACVHTRNNFDLESAAGIAQYRRYVDEAADLCMKYNGSLSGEHGDGQSRAELLPKMFGEELVAAFREFKSIWDPEWKMNPGKVVDPYLITENLHLGARFDPWSPKTTFSYPEDHGKLERAVMRCVGVGKCRRMDGGTMCPSYMVTREEQHSTRGRARLLFEMFNGETIPDNWQNEEVKESLDLCLACKGCKGDCPTGVDMATYKAEFFSHYYARKLRPIQAYTMGWIHIWSRIASKTPVLSNLMMRMMKPLLGVAPKRTMPHYAKQTFRDQWTAGRRPAGPPAASRRVLLWPDTFNNYFTPDTAMAASEVLEKLGYEVTIPKKNLCCGRPLYDWGFLGMAKRQLAEIMRELKPELDAGTPIIGLEPSCISVFRDELGNLFPGSETAKKLAKSAMTLSEFLHREKIDLPVIKKKAIVQGHCHHKAIMRFDPEEAVMKKMGLDYDHPDSGCCGMAGAFGFEEKNFDISMRAGERVLLPAVRAASKETLIIADGFSCREQIEQSTGRETMHLAEVLRLAMRDDG